MRPINGMENAMPTDPTDTALALDTVVTLDTAIADLFTLDRRVEPAEDLTGYACSGGCTDNGCSAPSTC